MKHLKKLALLIQERMPARCRVFFIYTHKNGFDRFNNGLKANTEISYWCFSALKENFPRISFLRVQDEKPERIRQVRPQDIAIGHIGPTFLEVSRRTKNLIAFNPWAGHEDRSKDGFNCAPHEREMDQFNRCASLILLTSEFNKREYIDRAKNFWHPYFESLKNKTSVRFVHQPIDLAHFKRIKWEYNTDNFLYIGNDAHMKCVDESRRLSQALGKNLTLYGIGTKKIDNLDQNQVGKLAAEGDFFIQPGMWEAQCVSILEAAARGFIPVVSPETGYPYSHPFLLRYNDFEYNLKVLRELLKTSPEERRQLADSLHEKLVADVEHNSWKRLTDVLVEEVGKIYAH